MEKFTSSTFQRTYSTLLYTDIQISFVQTIACTLLFLDKFYISCFLFQTYTCNCSYMDPCLKVKLFMIRGYVPNTSDGILRNTITLNDVVYINNFLITCLLLYRILISCFSDYLLLFDNFVTFFLNVVYSCRFELTF